MDRNRKSKSCGRGHTSRGKITKSRNMALPGVPGDCIRLLGAVKVSSHLQVGVPYLRAKAQDYYEELGGGIESDILEDGTGSRNLQMLTDEVSPAIRCCSND
jgi:peroxin-12